MANEASGARGNGAASGRRFLIDTNFFITLEPFNGSIEPGQRTAAEVVRLCSKQGHRVFVHPASRDEIDNGKNPERVRQRHAELLKYEMLEDEPPVSKELKLLAGDSEVDSNNHRDLRILAAVHANAAHYLVTNDQGLHRRAGRAGLGDRVLTLADAASMLASLEPDRSKNPPRIDEVQAYALDIDQDIFDSLRSEYGEEFLPWLDKVRGDFDNRLCFVIRDPLDQSYAAIAIIKRREIDCEYAYMNQLVSKICTFKVMDHQRGARLGELLLNAIMRHHVADNIASTYVEAYRTHQDLIDFLAQFGFDEAGSTARESEAILHKRYRPTASEARKMDPLEFHKRFGVGSISPRSGWFVVPVQTKWHEQLFPEAAHNVQPGEQMHLGPELVPIFPWGNAIRKAYICNSGTTQISPGDALLFYRSGGRKTVMAVGVVESTLRSEDADEVLGLTGGRTVYPAEDVRAMCQHPKGALVILFRLDRLLDPEIKLSDLVEHRCLKTHPQSVTRVGDEGTRWLQSRLNVLQ
ncbi:hypothetical protein GCM10009551_037590 [Nocardiopsis tropica]|uniref:GNAT family N-acetyltransferase n=1 Tax=Tsukamurella strandjordii TaxID=147577 RepID=UPI0031DBF004